MKSYSKMKYQREKDFQPSQHTPLKFEPSNFTETFTYQTLRKTHTDTARDVDRMVIRLLREQTER